MALQKLARYLFFVFIIINACSSPVDENAPREYDEEKITRLNNSEKFNYDREFETQEIADIGWLARFFGSIFSFIAFLFNNVTGYLFLIGLVILLVYLVMKNADTIFIRRNPDFVKPVKITQVENIEDVNYDQLLEAALKVKDYSLAVRYHFLHCLKFLQKSKLINWHLEKTNYEYLLEVPEAYYSPLDRLIYIYEYVWYGKFDATKETYQKLVVEAEKLQSKGGRA